MLENERFDTDRPGLCPGLCWKGKYVPFDSNSGNLVSIDGNFWCVYTQTCIGPDGQLAEPGKCCSSERVCYRTGMI